MAMKVKPEDTEPIRKADKTYSLDKSSKKLLSLATEKQIQSAQKVDSIIPFKRKIDAAITDLSKRKNTKAANDVPFEVRVLCQSENDDLLAWFAYVEPLPNNVCWLDDGSEFYLDKTENSRKSRMARFKPVLNTPFPEWKVRRPIKGWRGLRPPTVRELRAYQTKRMYKNPVRAGESFKCQLYFDDLPSRIRRSRPAQKIKVLDSERTTLTIPTVEINSQVQDDSIKLNRFLFRKKLEEKNSNETIMVNRFSSKCRNRSVEWMFYGENKSKDDSDRYYGYWTCGFSPLYDSRLCSINGLHNRRPRISKLYKDTEGDSGDDEIKVLQPNVGTEPFLQRMTLFKRFTLACKMIWRGSQETLPIALGYPDTIYERSIDDERKSINRIYNRWIPPQPSLKIRLADMKYLKKRSLISEEELANICEDIGNHLRETEFEETKIITENSVGRVTLDNPPQSEFKDVHHLPLKVAHRNLGSMLNHPPGYGVLKPEFLPQEFTSQRA